MRSQHSRSQSGLALKASIKHKVSESFTVLPKEPSSILKELRGRRTTKEAEVTPEVASAVVRNYLIPMFKANTEAKSAKARQALFQTQPVESTRRDKGTVLSELQLSSKLGDKLKQAESVILGLKRQLQDAAQERYSKQKELMLSKTEVLKSKAANQIWSTQCEEMKKAKQTVDLTTTLLRSQTRELRDICLDLEVQLKEVKQTLHDERVQTEKWRNRVFELEHHSQMLKMSNDVMTDHLKGLYEAVIKSLNVNTLQNSYCEELCCFVNASKTLEELDLSLGVNVGFTLMKTDGLKNDLVFAMKLQQETKQEKDKQSALFREYSYRVEAKLTELTQENELLKETLEQLSKQRQMLEEEYDKQRLRIKQFKNRKTQFGVIEEKVCKRCQRVYNEPENFNWSCKTHSSEYGGEIFWCCGKTSKDAPGCRLAKHESKDDEEGEADAEHNMKRESIPGVCVSCKESGHLAVDCPRDPNIRLHADYSEEMTRIKQVKNTKKKSTIHIENSQLKAVLAQKLHNKRGFSNQTVTSPVLSDDSDASMIEELGGEASFPDILSLKKSFAGKESLNLVTFDPVVLKENEARSKRRSLFSPEKGAMNIMKAVAYGAMPTSLLRSSSPDLQDRVKLDLLTSFLPIPSPFEKPKTLLLQQSPSIPSVIPSNEVSKSGLFGKSLGRPIIPVPRKTGGKATD
jgi:hypothetical protein